MSPSLRRRATLLLLIVTGTLLAGLGVWWVAYDAALRSVAERGRADLALASGRFIAQLQGFQEIAVLMSDHPTLGARLHAGEAASTLLAADAGTLLLSVADKTGVFNIVLLDADGRVQAAAHPRVAASVDHAAKDYFQRAMDGAIGRDHSVRGDFRRRLFSVAAPVHRRGGGAPLGAVVVVADIESTESEWRGNAPVVMFRDADGVVVVSSRSELVLTRDDARLPMAVPSAGYPPGALRPFPSFRESRFGSHAVWQISAGPYVPSLALHLTQDLPVIGFTGEVLADAAPARKLALLQMLVATGFLVTLWALAAFVWMRRHRLQRRLASEAAAKEILEQRVAARTAQLSKANTALRREVEDRTRAEEALRTTQDKLVQAGKLSALGEMSAGISHELNQPLMAIRSFAENGTQFIEMGRQDVAAANLGKISELALRMGRIIKNLRAFARQESAPLTDVDPGAVVEAALEISAGRLQRAGVSLQWTPPAAPMTVRAGSVRLQQVVMNLLSNAIDAMEGQDDKRIEISIAEEAGGHVAVRVRDTGPGIAEPEKIFDPFYSTKAVAQDSMGLGLSISYGLVQSFGGDIEGVNHPGGGAVFTVRLPRSGQEAAA